jgi:2-oxoglutarate dehydrogenase E1 component
LLPHGFEGQGPEHSSARLERFLQLCGQGNMQVACVSTPAQYFHLLRRQARLARRKPLVLLSPKSFLRHPEAVATLDELSAGAFREVLDDAGVRDAASIQRLVLCSGKLYYELLAHRRESGANHVALARIEQFYPFPKDPLTRLLARFQNVSDVVWAQEEPKNMGAWAFLAERFGECLQPAQRLRYVGRPRASSPATGSHKRHVAEQEALAREAIDGEMPGQFTRSPAAAAARPAS